MPDNLQDRYAPHTTCFGCGPSNGLGLQIKTVIEHGEGVCRFRPQPHHQAFDGYVNGGIIGAVFDCHCNWTAAWHLMQRTGADAPPSTVTAEYAVRFMAPTPADAELVYRARVVEASDRKATVEGELQVEGEITATCRATFVAIGPDHPAAGRW